MATGQIKQNPIIDYIAQKAKTEADTNMNLLAVKEQQDTINNATDDEIQSVHDSADAAGVVKAEQDATEATITFNRAQAANNLGFNPADTASRSNQLLATQQDAGKKAAYMDALITKKSAATLTSDPLTFINGLFTLNSDKEIHNYYARQHNQASAEYDDLVAKGTATSQAITALAATTSAATAVANQQAIQAGAVSKEAELRVRAAEYNIRGIQVQQSLSSDKLNQAEGAVRIDNMQQEMVLRRQHMALATQQFELGAIDKMLKIDMLTASREEKATAAQGIATATDLVNAGLASQGKPSMPTQEVMAGLKRQDPMILRLQQMGADWKLTQGGAPIVTGENDPASAAIFYKKLNPNPKGPDRGTKMFLNDAYNAAAADPTIQSEKDGNAKMGLINGKILRSAAEQQAAIDDTHGNIYSAAPFSAISAITPGVRDNKLIQDAVGKIAAANPSSTPTDAMIIASAKHLIFQNPGAINEVAASYAQYYQAAIDYNNNNKGYTQNGLPAQRTYNAAQRVGTFGGTLTLNLADPVAWKRIFMGAGLQGRSGLSAIYTETSR